ncbi:MAG: FtsX-like permease family protein [Litorimonas sp.]
MTSLARSNVGFHWRLFLSAVSVLALSGCLIYVAVGISAANIRSFTAYERSIDVDLYIRASGRNNSNALHQLLNDIDVYEDIAVAEPYAGRPRPQTVMIDDEGKRLTIAEIELDENIMLVPRFISSEAKQALTIPGTIIVSAPLQEKYGLELGNILWNPGKDFGLEIVGFFDAAINRGFVGSRTGYGFVSPETGRLFSPSSPSISFGGGAVMVGSRLSMIGVGVPATVSPEIAKQRLNLQFNGTPFEAITPEELVRSLSMDGILESKQVQGFLVVALFAVMIPLFIIVQTLRSAILTQSQQFATMRALGIPSRHLISTAMEQAFWVGVLGVGVSYCAMLGIKVGLLVRGIDMYVTLKVVGYVSAAILAAAFVAGIISLTAIFKMKPQDLLR